jgi:hypothetical protein
MTGLAVSERIGQSERVTVELIHFTAKWDGGCPPHRLEVRLAAEILGAAVREVDVDESQDEAASYRVMQVPSVAIAGDRDRPPIGGAQDVLSLVAALRPRLGG